MSRYILTGAMEYAHTKKKTQTGEDQTGVDPLIPRPAG